MSQAQPSPTPPATSQRLVLVYRSASQADSDEPADADVRLPAGTRFCAEDQPIPHERADAAARRERPLVVREGLVVGKCLARPEQAGADDHEWRNAGRRAARAEIDGDVAGDHQVTVMLATDVGNLGADADARRDVEPSRAAPESFRDRAIVCEDQRACREFGGAAAETRAFLR